MDIIKTSKQTQMLQTVDNKFIRQYDASVV